MKSTKGQEGFTLIELVIIILVLGILAATAIPKFYDMRTAANAAAEKGVVGGVRGGIAIIYASNVLNSPTGTFPAALDAVVAPATSSSANKLFTDVLSPGVDDGSWVKATATTYTGPAGNTFTYSSATGTFQ